MPKIGVPQVAIQYAFDCPCHGLQTQVFCWRAFDMKNLYRWHKLEVIITEVVAGPWEIFKYVKDLEKRTSSWGVP